ncbi:MAG: hypothetical protein DRN68_09160, partial [Thaumarchaeota archaeon]
YLSTLDFEDLTMSSGQIKILNGFARKMLKDTVDTQINRMLGGAVRMWHAPLFDLREVEIIIPEIILEAKVHCLTMRTLDSSSSKINTKLYGRQHRDHQRFGNHR